MPSSPPGERRLVTILFVHVEGLLTVSEQLDPEVAFTIVSACAEALSMPVYRYGGTVDKFIGPELMAVFGAPEVHEDDAARALWASLDMIEALERFNQAYHSLLPGPLAIRCGVNTGMVFAGDVGAPGLRAFTVIGDAVNLASRLAHLAEPGRVFVGEATYRQAQRLFYFQPLPPISVRGRQEEVLVHALLGAREGYWRAWGISGLSSPLVGRQREIGILQDHLLALSAGKGGVVSLIGEAGLGKSRLTMEIRSANQELRWLEGRSLSFQSDQPYFPFRNLVQRYTGIDEATPPADADERLCEAISRFASDQFDQVYPFLGYILGILPDKDHAAVLEPLSGEGLQRGLLRALRILLKGMAEDRPTVVVMEDLHWADRSSLDLLARLMPMAADSPLLFLLLLRPETGSGLLQWVRKEGKQTNRYAEIRLSPLSPQESVTLVANLLRTDRIPQALQEQILEKAEGNPLFMEEIVRTLIQDGVLAEREGRWEVAREVRIVHIPDTLRGLLASRVDGLEPEIRRTLRQAAVIGRVFPERVLAAVAGNGKELAQHLRVLLDRNFIRYYRLEGEQGRAFIFNHALTHEATYEGILIEERRLLHRRTLEEMERLYAGRLEALYATLARHAYLGEVWDKAAYYLHLAGDRAKAAYALPEAVHHYQRAMGIIQEYGVKLDRERLADLYHECCSAQIQLGDYRAARVVCNVLMETAERLNDPYLRGHALRAAALIAAYTGDTVAQVSSAQAACRELERAGADWSRGTALFLLALGLFKSGRLDEAGAAIEKGLQLVGDTRRWPGYDPRSEALFYAGLIAIVQGRLDVALERLESGIALTERTGEQSLRGFCTNFAGLAYGLRGEYARGLEKAEEGKRLGMEADLPLVTESASACAAWICALSGCFGETFRAALPLAFRKPASLDARAIACLALGDACLGTLEFEEGMRYYQQALEIAGLSHIVTASAMRGIGLAHVLLGNPQQGIPFLDNSLSATTSLGLKWFRAQILRDMAWVHLRSGDRAAAESFAGELLALAEEGDYRELIGWGYFLRGSARGDGADIRRGLESGMELGSLLLQWAAGEALVALTGDEKGRAAARTAVQAIAEGLPPQRRAAFLNREPVRAILEGESREHSGSERSAM